MRGSAGTMPADLAFDFIVECYNMLITHGYPVFRPFSPTQS